MLFRSGCWRCRMPARTSSTSAMPASACISSRTGCGRPAPSQIGEHTSELQSHSDLHSFPTRCSSDLGAGAVGCRRAPHLLLRCRLRPAFPRALGAGDRHLLRSESTRLNSSHTVIYTLSLHDALPIWVLALSDAGAHLIYFCDAGFGLHFLAHWVRETGTFTLEEGVRRLTSDPARKYRIPKRGLIKAGHSADLLAFDPRTVGISNLERAADLPGGGSRMIRK